MAAKKITRFLLGLFRFGREIQRHKCMIGKQPQKSRGLSGLTGPGEHHDRTRSCRSLQFGLYIACDPHIIIRDRIEYIVRRVGSLKSPEPEVTHVAEYAVFFCIRRTFMAENKVMTLRLEPELRKRLDGLAKAQRRSRSFIAAEAIREYVAVKNSKVDE